MSFPPGSMICTAWPSACRALMCWRSVSPMRPTRCSRDDRDGAAGRARRGGRREAWCWCCAPGCCSSGTSLEISRFSSAWPSSSSRIFRSSSSAAITGGAPGAVLLYQMAKHQGRSRSQSSPQGGSKVGAFGEASATRLPRKKGTFLSISGRVLWSKKHKAAAFVGFPAIRGANLAQSCLLEASELDGIQSYYASYETVKRIQKWEEPSSRRSCCWRPAAAGLLSSVHCSVLPPGCSLVAWRCSNEDCGEGEGICESQSLLAFALVVPMLSLYSLCHIIYYLYAFFIQTGIAWWCRGWSLQRRPVSLSTQLWQTASLLHRLRKAPFFLY